MDRKDNIFKSNAGVLKTFAFTVATFFGVGFAPKAPGTAGSLAALPFVWLMLYFGGVGVLALGTVITGVTGYFLTAVALSCTADKDPSYIVIDEVIGQFITFLIPALLFKEMHTSVVFYALGFVLFRLFDIIKPHYVGWADEYLDGALGVTADDVVAGVYASVVMVVLLGIWAFMKSRGI